MGSGSSTSDIIVGAALIAAGVFLVSTSNPYGANLIMAGVGLVLAGAATINTPPPTQDTGISNLAGASVDLRDSLAPWRYIYGAPRVGGVFAFVATTGGNNEILRFVLVLAAHELESIGQMYINDVAVDVDGSGNAQGFYAGYVFVGKKLGTPNQTSFSGLTSGTTPEITSQGIRIYYGASAATSSALTAYNGAQLDVVLQLQVLRSAPGTIISYADGAEWKLVLNADGSYSLYDTSGLRCTSPAYAYGMWQYVGFGGNATQAYISVGAFTDAMTVVATSAGAWGHSGASGKIRLGTLDGASDFTEIDVGYLTVAVGGVQQGFWWQGSGFTNDQASHHNNFAYTAIIGSDATFAGRAAVSITLIYNQAIFPNGLPTFTFDVQGKKVIDPRTEQTVTAVDAGLDTITCGSHVFADGQEVIVTADGLVPGGLTDTAKTYWVINPGATAAFKLCSLGPGSSTAVDITDVGSGTIKVYERNYSNNAALCVGDYICEQQVGMSATMQEMDISAWSSSANTCDEDVPLAAGGTEKRYTCDGTFTVDNTRQNIVEDMLTSMLGQLAYVAGKFQIFAAVWRTPTITLSEDDIRGDTIAVTGPQPQRSDNFNAVKGVFSDPSSQWQPTDYPPYINATYVAQDGLVIYHDLNLPYTKSASMAQRLAKILLLRQRNGLMVEISCMLTALDATPPDNVYLDNTVLGWNAKTFEVLTSQLAMFQVDGEDNVYGVGVNLKLRETASAIFDWSAEESALDLTPNTSLPDATTAGQAPTGMTLASGTDQLLIRSDGTIWSRILVSWTQVTDVFVTSGGLIEVQFKKSVDSDWQPAGVVSGNSTFAYIVDVNDGESYDVRIRSRSSIGRLSTFTEVDGHTVIGKTAPPSDVSGFNVTQNGTLAVMRWEQITDIDLAGYEIRIGNPGDPWATGDPLTETEKGTEVTTAVVPQGTWDIMIKAVDTSLNESTDETRVTFTMNATFNAVFDIYQGVIGWPGDLLNLVKDPITHWLSPQCTQLASMQDWETFDYTLPAPLSASYTAQEVDTGGDDHLSVSAAITYSAGPDATVSAIPRTQIGYHKSTDAYDGFENWVVGEIAAAHYVKHRFLVDLSVNNSLLVKTYRTITDLLEHSETGENVVIAAGGTDIVYTREYREVPEFTVDLAGDTSGPTGAARYAVHFGGILTGIRVWLIDASNNDVGGYANYTVTGI